MGSEASKEIIVSDIKKYCNAFYESNNDNKEFVLKAVNNKIIYTNFLILFLPIF